MEDEKPKNIEQENTNLNTKPIKINVGGKIFETLTTTLSKWKNSKFEEIITNQKQFPIINDGIIFFDRNPKYFEIILDYLRTSEVTIPKKLNNKEGLSRLIKESKYYSIHSLTQLLNEKIQVLQRQSFTMKEFQSQAYLFQANTPREPSHISQPYIPIMDAGRIERQDLTGLSLTFIRIQNFEFIDCLFGPSTYFNTNFENCKFDGSRFEGVNFHNSKFIDCSFQNVEFVNVELWESLFKTKQNFKGSVFKLCTLNKTNFSKSILDNSSFIDCKIIKCKFSGCEINNICIPEKQFKSNFKGAKVTNLIDISKYKTKIKEVQEWNEVLLDIDKWKQHKDQK
ncbi:btb/poz domain-containing adapter for cul3-mediated rhoa degradation protein family member [Anaeramoeba ignava]|uniref:Btb/poz domain-containing adapter for cul3-mediated rhoa degradation protein family member n=1 Tax=Anaeramoeba ignava TaxID=1746090 RepID=A0A9Q0RDT7_ANAIG|nr:btb/poz domain-containing adapter for cul3-mediated rhoa degradation protein family member [Anaeramoeba ignava]